MKTLGLCWRCEHRATFHDTGFGPRSECQQTEMAVHSCYMYRPVKPLVLAPDKGDRRPMGAPAMIAARAHAVRVAEGEYHGHKGQGGLVVWFEPSPQKGQCSCGGNGGRAAAADDQGPA